MPDKSNIYHVASVSWKGHLKRLCIEPSGHSLLVPLSACVSKGDRVKIEKGNAWVICKNGESQFLGPYFVRRALNIGALKLKVAVKEITEIDEHDAYMSLAEFHYRGHVIHGRTARLIIRTFHPAYPKVIGYIELATPFYMNKARAVVLNAPFSIDSVKWQRWDMSTYRKYIHVLVRIARVVVSPEFRGLGIGQILVKHASEFAKRRWQVAGYIPYFLEISADMLKYIPFAERAGMTFVGETEGNLQRVAKDMNYLLSRFETDRIGQTEFGKTCGICDEQISRMRMALKVMEREGLSQKDLVKRLRSLSRESVLKDFALFHKIITLPKPHYMMGLYPQACQFLRRRVVELLPQNGSIPPKIKVSPIVKPILLENVELSYVSRIRRTKSTHAVQQAFGISPDNLRTTVIRGLTIKIIPGEIVLVVGPSGSGKSSLLNLLKDKHQDRKEVYLSENIRNIVMPENARIGSFEPIRSAKPLIEVLGAKDVRYGLYLLGLAGISEAFLYLKRFSELSAGQQYRAMLAQLLASKCNIWIADDFCANLDPVTANIVGHNIQHIARIIGATVVLAASHSTHFLFSLKPDRVILLTSVWEHRIVSGQEYCRIKSKNQGVNGYFPSLRLLPQFMEAVREGRKTTTIRIGKKIFEAELLLLESSVEEILMRVVDVEYKQFSQLTHEDAYRDGAINLQELRETLIKIYPRLRERTTVTIVHFEPICGILYDNTYNGKLGEKNSRRE